jgi:hypothetical protein
LTAPTSVHADRPETSLRSSAASVPRAGMHSVSDSRAMALDGPIDPADVARSSRISVHFRDGPPATVEIGPLETEHRVNPIMRSITVPTIIASWADQTFESLDFGCDPSKLPPQIRSELEERYAFIEDLTQPPSLSAAKPRAWFTRFDRHEHRGEAILVPSGPTENLLADVQPGWGLHIAGVDDEGPPQLRNRVVPIELLGSTVSITLGVWDRVFTFPGGPSSKSASMPSANQ